MTYSDPKMTYSYPKVIYSYLRVTYSDPTHLPLPPPTSPEYCLLISWVKLNLWVVVVVGGGGGGGGWQPNLV